MGATRVEVRLHIYATYMGPVVVSVDVAQPVCTSGVSPAGALGAARNRAILGPHACLDGERGILEGVRRKGSPLQHDAIVSVLLFSPPCVVCFRAGARSGRNGERLCIQFMCTAMGRLHRDQTGACKLN